MENNKKIEAKFIAQEGKDFIFKDNRIVLTPEFMNKNKFRFSKVTATRLPGVLNIGDMNSQVKTWAQMVKIYKEDMDPMVSNVGVTLENKIREYIENYFKKSKNIDFVYSFYEPSEYKWDVFKDTSKYFGGIPDAEPYFDVPKGGTYKDGKLDFNRGIPLLEIKTCSIDAFKYVKDGPLWILQKDEKGEPIVKTLGGKKSKWVDPITNKIHVPEEYACQLSMYLYLRGLTKGLIVCYLVDTKDYAHPDNIKNLNPKNLVGSWITIDPTQFKKTLDIAENWYKQFIETGISPELTEKDWQWIREVKTQNLK